MLEVHLGRLRRVIAQGGPANTIDAALIPIAEARDPGALVPLMLELNDDSDDHGMWSIVHVAERLDNEVYIEQFLKALPIIASARWASILMMRVLNCDPARLKLVHQLRAAAPEAKKTAARLCNQINGVDVRFLSNTIAILIAAEE